MSVKIERFEVVIRHEPGTDHEPDSGWWYEHFQFDSENNETALKEAKEFCIEYKKFCSKKSMESCDYGCWHYVDELYHFENKKAVSIYDDGRYQWGMKGEKDAVKRFTDGTVINFLKQPISFNKPGEDDFDFGKFILCE